jgi:trimethylamine:corrinoid methyltransferase-like protein
MNATSLSIVKRKNKGGRREREKTKSAGVTDTSWPRCRRDGVAIETRGVDRLHARFLDVVVGHC